MERSTMLLMGKSTINGKHTNNYGKIHHAINGKIHYFDWAMFNCFLYVHQRVVHDIFFQSMPMSAKYGQKYGTVSTSILGSWNDH